MAAAETKTSFTSAAYETVTPARALVLLRPIPAAGSRPLRRSATFLAQLIATDLGLPSTRSRRRTSAALAAAAYHRAASAISVLTRA